MKWTYSVYATCGKAETNAECFNNGPWTYAEFSICTETITESC